MDFISIMSIFVMACFVGYYVVWSVTPALHTPLMAVTNAISSVIIVGALIGGALGAAVGYYTGCQEQGGCFVGGKQVAGRDDLVYDNRERRYYYVDRGTGRTYWENGDLRG